MTLVVEVGGKGRWKAQTNAAHSRTIDRAFHGVIGLIPFIKHLQH